MIESPNYDKQDDATLDSLLEGFQLIGSDWRYLYVNKSVVEQSKCTSKEELLGYTMMEKFPGIENTEMFKTLQKCMKERVSASIENEFKYPDNSIGWFELRIEPVPKGVFILSMNITERKKAEQENKKHIEGIKEMLFMTSHKIRQPIANILGLSNLLDRELNSQEELKKIIDYMKESVLTLDTFTRDLTKFMSDLGKEK
jgi:PAS domain S-box-containing protein